jgi:glucose-1-phosphate adenylyltransferase
MGIYLFNLQTLIELLTKSDYQDFGKEVFPMAIRTHKVHVHLFDGYWEDIGTIRSFYEANLDLTLPNAPFKLEDEKSPIYTHARFLPPSRCDGVHVKRSLIADGCVIGEGSMVENSVVGLRCKIGDNVTIANSILMGADNYQTDADVLADKQAGIPNIGVGDGSLLDGVIVDKNCRIGKGVHIRGGNVLKVPENTPVVIQDGIIVIPKGTILPDGWRL